jgi:mannosyltransferase
MPPRAPQPAAASTTGDAQHDDRLMRWALAAILLLAGCLRLYNLDRLSFWFDEFLTLTIAGEPLAKIPAAVRQSEQTPPLLHVLMHGWIKLFGVSEFAVRSPAAVFGIAAVWVTYLLGLALFGRREGLVAALLMALSGFQIAYSQEARVYSLLLLVALTSSLFFVKLLREGGTLNQVAYVLATGILYWTHLHAVFVVAAQQVTWLYLRFAPSSATDVDRPVVSTRRWAVLSALSVALFAPWIPTVVYWFRSVSHGFWIPPMGTGFLPHVYALFAGSAILLAPMLLLSAWAVYRTPDRWKVVFLASLALLPVLVPYVASLLLRPLFVHRYAITAAAGLFLLVGRGLTTLPERGSALVMLALMTTLSAISIPAVRREVDNKPDVRAASRYVSDSAHEGDYILLDGGAASTTLLQYLHAEGMGRFTVVLDPAQLPAAGTVPPQTTLWSISVIPRDATDTPPPQPPQLGWQPVAAHPFDHVTVREWARSSQAPNPGR